MKNKIKALLCMMICFLVMGNVKNINTEALDIKTENPIYAVDIPDKKVSITFDVNWAEKDYTRQILDILDENDIKATFFVIGKWITYNDENSKLLKEISDRGHEIGNHSNSHADFAKISSSNIHDEIEAADKKIKDITGMDKVYLFRFPSGSYNKNAVCKVIESGHIPIQWGVDSIDWKESGLEAEYNRVMKKIYPGCIILFHNNAKYTPENLKRIIPKMKDMGYDFLKVSDLLYKEDFYIDANGVQIKR